jgi:uncharacterized cupin superfamily protein
MADDDVPVVRDPLTSGELGGRDLVVVEWTAEASPSGDPEPIAPLHVHHDDDEVWYVLDGSLGLLLDGREVTVGAGGAAIARAGVAHTYWNAARTDTRYLLVMTPRIRALIATLHDPVLAAGRSMEQIFTDHRSALAPTPPNS